MKINKNYNNLQDSYLFSTIAKKVETFKNENPDKNIIRMGIGDVTLPLCSAVVEEMKKAADEMAVAGTFRGYGPEQGYDFLKNAILDYYSKRNVTLKADEVFVSDGAKSDVSNILDIFSVDNTVLIPNPVYPVYLDTNIMAGRKIEYLDANESNKFLPLMDDKLKVDIIYICSPNNPTGEVYTKSDLKTFVDYAIKNNAVILFDAAYESFIQDDSLPRSIYEVEGAEKCSIELCSLSKTAGFTGTRCGYTVVPHSLVYDDTKLNKLWNRRQTTKFNGVSYVIQRAAAAVFTDRGQAEVARNIAYYMQNAKVISDSFTEMGVWFVGGYNSPYIWMKCPKSMSSWETFDYFLNKAYVVGTPGAGFGENGEGYFRLTAFGNAENTIEAMKRLKSIL